LVTGQWSGLAAYGGAALVGAFSNVQAMGFAMGGYAQLNTATTVGLTGTRSLLGIQVNDFAIADTSIYLVNKLSDMVVKMAIYGAYQEIGKKPAQAEANTGPAKVTSPWCKVAVSRQ
jgi:hypothetical protein